jgi:hypothetical protein
MITRKVENEYFIPGISAVQKWESRNGMVNELSYRDVKTVVEHWILNDSRFNYVSLEDRPDLPPHDSIDGVARYFKDDLVPTKKDGHPQATIPRKLYKNLDAWEGSEKSGQIKVLRHLVVWRYMFKGALLPKNLDISHCDHDHTILNLVAESRDLNESRKYCHLFRWTCPHEYHKCT